MSPRHFFSVFLVLVLSASSLNLGRFAGASNPSEMEGYTKTVVFEGSTKEISEAEMNLESTPGEVKVVIKSSAASGGYSFMAYDVIEGVEELPKLQVKALPEEEMKQRLSASVTKHGVTLTKPSITDVNKMPGAPQNYIATIKVEHPGNFTAIIGKVRGWSPHDSPSFYVVRIRASE